MPKNRDHISLYAGTDIHRADEGRIEGGSIGVNHIADINIITGLTAVAVDDRSLSSQKLS